MIYLIWDYDKNFEIIDFKLDGNHGRIYMRGQQKNKKTTKYFQMAGSGIRCVEVVVSC